MSLSPDELQTLARLGVATVYEASGREGLVDLPLLQLVPGSRVAGPALTVLCAQNDNLMVHAAMAAVRPGEVLVFAMPEPAPVALVGELLATQAQAQRASGMLVDAAVRDAEELSQMGLPIWARYVRARGAERKSLGQIGVPLRVGGALIRTGDILVLDADGAVVVAQERAREVLEAAQARAQREEGLRGRFRAGELSIDLYGLREQVASALAREEA
ncbi:4-carboxy-4-hydroxy-2-oxoadipate aldolase/oxaloacetate decarboxylase [Meiothermus sp.]|jgi:4-hydroxy-4-methyl-2-oxoglutarate aldolase|uniref:4-carboxy-4-hydroxy-2-oxoadipate aldolase/oxaloacetate decarboxylase n=1 Tax=Meiothermus sp. TaxID=1955249 RepID=UPI0021DEA5E0|nr:4-carboxy-4-hydroxy-2-oxoadipate aldolase/oxaloacetate decarboxylase [Meiothermus sp.]GIW24004.1 MAG: methyltransferase [Meiothermus sp.]